MNKATRIALWVLLLAGVAAVSFLVGRTVQDPPASASAERAVLYWQAPMNPAEVYDRPGKSAMGMDLIPVYAEPDAGDGGGIVIDPGTAQNMGVRTSPVTRMDFFHTIRSVGTVEYNEEKVHAVSARISGWIEALPVSFVGQPVEQGDTLLTIHSPELVTAQHEYLLALDQARRAEESSFAALHEDARQLLSSARERMEFWNMSRADIERLSRTRVAQRTVAITAPAPGIVTHTGAVEGAHVTAGTDLFTIADLSTVWVHASVQESDLAAIAPGHAAKVTSTQLPLRPYHGSVSYIYPFLREEARDLIVRLVFGNPDGALRPGMFVDVALQGQSYPDALCVPSESVIRSGERAVAFVQAAPGEFVPREIEVGGNSADGQHTRVVAGLSEGEHVVTAAQFMIDSESRLQEALQAARTPEEAEGEMPSMPPMDHEHMGH